MTINLIILGQFMRKSAPVLSAKGRLFVGAITAHATTFTNPRPALASITNALDEMDAASQNYMASRSVLDKLVLQEKQKVVEDLLRQLSTFSNTVANGNRSIAALTLMELRKENEPMPPITYVETPVLTTLTTGKMRSRTKAVDGARMYKHCITDDLSIPVEEWKSYDSSRVSFVFPNLVPGKIYHVCVAACGIDSQCVYSDYATKMAV